MADRMKPDIAAPSDLIGDIKSVWKEGAVPFVADLGK
jgi:hypothetical protein